MDTQIDLEVALRTMHQLGLEDGDIGYAYWHQVAELLRTAAATRERLADVEHELATLKVARLQASGGD